jgi:hypothetical protein
VECECGGGGVPKGRRRGKHLKDFERRNWHISGVSWLRTERVITFKKGGGVGGDT